MTTARTCCGSTTRSRTPARRWLLATLGLLLAGSADAHPTPFSYLTLELDGASARGSLVMHEYDVAHELGIADPDTLLQPDEARRQQLPLRLMVDGRMRLAFDGRPLQAAWQPIEVQPAQQSVGMRFALAAPAPAVVELDMLLFPYDDQHQTFVSVYEGGALRLQAVLDAAHPTMRYYSGSLQGRWAVVRTFVQSGVHHILIGPDHILFLMGLLLLGGSMWRLASIVTAFTAGHSITLSLAALQLVRLPSSVIEPAIALSIVVVGTDNLLVQRQRVPSAALPAAAPGTGARDLRPWFAGAFGLIHGFGFAAVLTELGLPRDALGWSLAAFNIGVEIGQLLIVLPTATLLWWLWRISPRSAERSVLAGSVVVVAAGVYWFVQRIWFTAP